MNKSRATTFIILCCILMQQTTYCSAPAYPKPNDTGNQRVLIANPYPIIGTAQQSSMPMGIRAQTKRRIPLTVIHPSSAWAQHQAQKSLKNGNEGQHLAQLQHTVLPVQRRAATYKPLTQCELFTQLKQINPRVSPERVKKLEERIAKPSKKHLEEAAKHSQAIQAILNQMEQLANTVDPDFKVLNELIVSFNNRAPILAKMNRTEAQALQNQGINLQIKIYVKKIDLLIQLLNAPRVDQTAITEIKSYLDYLEILEGVHKDLQKIDPSKAQMYDKHVPNFLCDVAVKLEYKARESYYKIRFQLSQINPNLNVINSELMCMKAIEKKLHAQNNKTLYNNVNNLIKKIRVQINYMSVKHYLNNIAIELEKTHLDIEKINAIFDPEFEPIKDIRYWRSGYDTEVNTIIAKMEGIVIKKLEHINAGLSGDKIQSEMVLVNLDELACLIENLAKLDEQKAERYKKALNEKKAQIKLAHLPKQNVPSAHAMQTTDTATALQTHKSATEAFVVSFDYEEQSLSKTPPSRADSTTPDSTISNALTPGVIEEEDGVRRLVDIGDAIEKHLMRSLSDKAGATKQITHALSKYLKCHEKRHDFTTEQNSMLHNLQYIPVLQHFAQHVNAILVRIYKSIDCIDATTTAQFFCKAADARSDNGWHYLIMNIKNLINFIGQHRFLFEALMRDPNRSQEVNELQDAMERIFCGTIELFKDIKCQIITCDPFTQEYERWLQINNRVFTQLQLLFTHEELKTIFGWESEAHLNEISAIKHSISSCWLDILEKDLRFPPTVPHDLQLKILHSMHHKLMCEKCGRELSKEQKEKSSKFIGNNSKLLLGKYLELGTVYGKKPVASECNLTVDQMISHLNELHSKSNPQILKCIRSPDNLK